MPKLISIIIPVCNEQKNIPLVYEKIKEVFLDIKDCYEYEIIFIDDGSLDNSASAIAKIIELDKKVKCLEFSRNFGKEAATSAGMHNAKGDAAIMIDADLQFPAELIPAFIEKWENGAEIVIGVRLSNKGEGLVKKIGSWAFYKLMNLMGDSGIVSRGTDFRLMDRLVIDEFNRFTEITRVTRGLIDWLGFKKDFIYFAANEREHGKAAYGNIKLIKLAFAAMVTQSTFPLRVTGYLGGLICLISAPLGLFIFVEKYLLNDPLGMNFSGTATLAVILLFLVGIILVCMGLMALYIGNIKNEISNRPMYVVRQKKNL
jgi:dolichol-phosphate mannosyltransferase